MDDAHRRPAGADDRSVEAAGKVAEAMEWVERARGRVYDFHQMIGRADLFLDEASALLEAAGADDLAERIRTDIIGRNVLEGRWTYQVVEEFDSTYYRPVVAAEKKVRDELLDGKRHVYEAEMKERRRSKGVTGHESEPRDGG
jgi:hypothetical protein